MLLQRSHTEQETIFSLSMCAPHVDVTDRHLKFTLFPELVDLMEVATISSFSSGWLNVILTVTLNEKGEFSQIFNIEYRALTLPKVNEQQHNVQLLGKDSS